MAARPAPSGPPGADMAHAKGLSVGMSDEGEIAPGGVAAFYRFDNKLGVRDIALVRLDNESATLKPDFKIYDENKSQIFERYDSTAGASAEQTLTIEPGKAIYFEVLPYSSAGKYKISVTMQDAADAFEANDDILTARAAAVGADIAANIMDAKDNDFYKITGATKTPVTIALENQSTTLKPNIKVFNANKSQMMEKYDATAGANLSFEAAIEPGQDFYVEVLPYGSAGKYKLTVK